MTLRLLLSEQRSTGAWRQRPLFHAFQGAVLVAGVMFGILSQPSTGAELPWLTQAEFRKALDRPLLAHREEASLREILDHLSAERSVAILLDRRFDPDQRVTLAINQPDFVSGLSSLVEPLGARVIVMADTLFITTPETARTLRTRVELAETSRDSHEPDPGALFANNRRGVVQWPMLSTPAEIVTGIAQQHHLQIGNLSAIPHDLWPAGSIAYPNAAEALSIVVAQFDLDVAWTGVRTVHFQPAASQPEVRRSHRLTGLSAEEAVGRVRTAFPDREVSLEEQQLVFRGLVEEHEQIAVLLGERPAKQTPPVRPPAPLSKRRFTLTMIQQPFQSLVDLLREQGVEVAYDASAIREAGIDLNTRLTLELDQATIHQLLEGACRPLRLGYRVEGIRIELFPERE